MNDQEHVDGPLESGLDRRTLLRRSAVVGGALVWATPVVQSIASPAFAAGSPGGSEVCVDNYQFKADVSGTVFGSFETGEAPGCTPSGYDPKGTNFVTSNGTIPNGHGTISLTLSADGNTATIVIPNDCKLLDGQAKAGSPKSATGNLECRDAVPSGTNGTSNIYTVTLTKDISFVAGVICCV